MSPELETLDQLLGGKMPLPVIRGLYSDDARFANGLSALLHAGDVRLLGQDGADVPRWMWREVLADPSAWPPLVVHLTEVGARRIG